VLIHLDNIPSPGQPDDKVIMFFKRKPDVITPENMHRYLFIKNKTKSIMDSPVSALYHALQKVKYITVN